MKFQKILVPVSGNRASDDAIRLACSLVKETKGKVFVIYVVEVRRSLPLEAEIEPDIRKGEDALAQAETVAEEEEYEVQTDLLQAREVGPAVVDEASEQEVDLILMGLAYKKRFGEFSLGTAAPYVLKYAPCPVLLLREVIP